MFDVSTTSSPEDNASVLQLLADPAERSPYEHRAAPEALLSCLSAVLDEVDYGMVLLDHSARAVYVNHAARVELDDSHPLQLLERRLQARRPKDAAMLNAALDEAARRGLRKLLTLSQGCESIGVSVVPLAAWCNSGAATTLVMLGKRDVCEELSVQGFAKAHGLTPAETRVLVALCKGEPPDLAAARLGVAISTVRTQIGTIRLKTGASSIRALVRQVSVLPPLMGVLRGQNGARPGAYRREPLSA
ncbi:MAG: helix-turn-helix transcriptional regulator [Pseudomonadota bacterium]|nr:helix-turn-helix transcriptional regulator [Pseudomonadota bacterium]